MKSNNFAERARVGTAEAVQATLQGQEIVRLGEIIETGRLHRDADAAPNLFGLMVDIIAGDHNAAGRLLEERRKNLEGSALARAVGPKKPKELPLMNSKIDTINSARPTRIDHNEVFDVNDSIPALGHLTSKRPGTE